jgi:hypothetical protein
MATILISTHALEQMADRGITEEQVLQTINSPGQELEEPPDKRVYQSVLPFGADGKEYLLRVFVNIVKQPKVVITVYKTSKVEKYWLYES